MGHTTIIIDSQNTHMMTEHSCGEQTLIGCLVEPLPHLESYTAFSPFHILMFANDTTLREKSHIIRKINDSGCHFIDGNAMNNYL